MKTVLFVCTGNTCRSPMAQGYFNSLDAKGSFTALSAGLYADGSPMSKHSKTVLNENQIHFQHTSVQVTEALMEKADYVFGITSSHASQLISMFPMFADKIYVLPQDIQDPFGADLEVYRQCFAQIKANVDLLYKHIAGENEK